MPASGPLKILLCCLVLVGCFSDLPSESEAEAIFQERIAKQFGRPPMRVIYFRKTDGMELNRHGQQIYKLQFVAEVEFPNGANLDCAPLRPRVFDTRACRRAPDREYAAIGARITYRDEFDFWKTELGWQAQQKYLRYSR